MEKEKAGAAIVSQDEQAAVAMEKVKAAAAVVSQDEQAAVANLQWRRQQ